MTSKELTTLRQLSDEFLSQLPKGKRVDLYASKRELAKTALQGFLLWVETRQQLEKTFPKCGKEYIGLVEDETCAVCSLDEAVNAGGSGVKGSGDEDQNSRPAHEPPPAASDYNGSEYEGLTHEPEADAESAWLIEKPSALGPQWASNIKLHGTDWTADANKALRFAREQDANAAVGFIRYFDGNSVKATEHVWCSTSPCHHGSTVNMTLDSITDKKAIWRCNGCRELFSFELSTAAHVTGASRPTKGGEQP